MTNGPGYGGPYPSGAAASAFSLGQTEGVLGRRLFTYLLDLAFVFGLMLLLGFAILIFGVVTFGLGWWLYAILVPGTAILYSAVTVGGPSQSTIGMRIMGLRAIHAASGGRVDGLTAAVHALLFYIAAGTFFLWLLDLFIGMARGDRRLGHDLLVGIAVVRST